MIIVLKPHTTKDDVSRVENMVKKRGLDTHIVQGKEMTVILSTHIVSDVEETADYILVMNEGKVLENHAMSYYMKQIEDKELTGLEQYYLHLTGRKLHDTGNEI